MFGVVKSESTLRLAVRGLLTRHEFPMHLVEATSHKPAAVLLDFNSRKHPSITPRPRQEKVLLLTSVTVRTMSALDTM